MPRAGGFAQRMSGPTGKERPFIHRWRSAVFNSGREPATRLDPTARLVCLVLAEFGRVPRAGESLDLEGYRLVVEQVVRRRVKRIAVHRLRVEPSMVPSEKAGR